MTHPTWNHILHILERSLNPGLYQVWIKPLSAAVADGRICLTAPNEFVAAWVRDRLTGQIAEAAAQVMGGAPAISVTARDTSVTPLIETSTALPAPKPEAPAPAGDCVDPAFRFSFDQFVVGPSNALAYEASLGLCRRNLPANQLFISAGPGLGKTHLSQAIGRMMLADMKQAKPKVRYLSAEEFSSRLILSIKMREMDRFKARFRENVDILILEDIHFFQGKLKLQDELLNTINTLESRGCRVVFTSSFLPKELSGLDNQLASRLGAGFLATIDQPDYATRLNILRRKASLHQVLLPEDVADLLANKLRTDIRQLESCLQNLALKARILGQGICMDMAWDVLRNYDLEQPSINLDQIVDYVCNVYSIQREHLVSKSRKRQHVIARNTAFFLARKHTPLSLQDIGQRFNRRHSTVVKGITAVERQLTLQTPLGRQLETAIDRLAQ
ncbi:chromosomal replication initiator protein DnaA [Fundidesulfovibrio soli]|uniref:chromosomal replication initiator protein DnaA n=1 Tax=Fundidesulfovibrio soli TaxID=2922716 RepID=UPI001FAE7AE2|nr:chromosomal replication initiator protein DnaA [Fundidesulfovibrio soli]